MIIREDVIAHVGRPHEGMTPHSGRYKWGSGDNAYQHATSFLVEVERLQKQLGLSEVEAARALDMTTTELRARKTAAKAVAREYDVARARQLREKGESFRAIADKMGISSTKAKALAEGGMLEKTSKAQDAHDLLKANIDEYGYVDYSTGVHLLMGVSSTQLNTAVQMLKDEGYTTEVVHIKQLGRDRQYTDVRVLAPPGTKRADVMANLGKIRAPMVHIDAEGTISGATKKPVSISGKRVKVVYDEDGGSLMDGVVEVRRGVKELEIANGRYAQVRIMVNGTHYIKGMAVYADDLPAGIDLRVNSNKKRGTPMLGDDGHTVLKIAKKDDPLNPFGSNFTQKEYKDSKTGRRKLSALNYVHEEGDWDSWSKSLPSQFLSKQRVSEAKRQLAKTRTKAQSDLDDILALENPVVRKKLLLAYADRVDSKSVDLKAAAYPRQASQVILPVKSLKPTEVYAPNYKHGERVALVRFPHAGTFEIPELVVNNRHKKAAARVGKNARDAIGIHPSVAERLSGADFDGDSVLVIPNNKGKVRSSAPLRGLEGFDPKRSYPYRAGMKVMSKKQTQQQMGSVSNLITDMQLKGASTKDIAAAVRHSMVVIDAHKHRLDYKQSEKDNNIPGLKKKYQGKSTGGASTIISRASSPVYLDQVRKRRASEGGPIDPKTGELVYVKTGAGHYKKYKDASGKWHTTKTWIPEVTKTDRMRTVRDAHKLSSGTPMEKVYADHANGLKALANRARKAALSTQKTPYSSEAAVKYAPEVKSLRGKLDRALKAKPKERQAQIIANAKVRLRKQSDPSLADDTDALKKVERRELANAKARVGYERYQIEFTPREWEAVQKGAIHTNFMEDLVANASADHVQQLATPRPRKKLTATQASRVRSLLNRGYTNDEVAEVLGVSGSTLRAFMQEEGL